MAAKHYPGYATTKETAAAQVFLRLLGADALDPDLIAVVVAWVRSGGGPQSNPLRQMVRGKLVHYSSLTDALRAAAARLIRAKELKGFGLIVRAFQRGHANEALVAIAMSGWDKDHYGLDKDGLPDAHLLLKAFNRIKEVKFAPLPQKNYHRSKNPTPTKYLEAPVPPYQFTNPQAVVDFYADRHSAEQTNDFGGIMTVWKPTV